MFPTRASLNEVGRKSFSVQNQGLTRNLAYISDYDIINQQIGGGEFDAKHIQT